MRSAQLTIAAVLLFPVAARAWDSPELWNNPANGGNAAPGAAGAIAPGGGGIFGTGGARDYFITCANCHINDKAQQGVIDLTLAFNPPMAQLNGQYRYQAGQAYQVTAQLRNEHLGLSGCGAYVTGNLNNVAAAVEDSSGRPAGVLASDSGQSAGACPSALPQVTSGTTMMYGDCHAVFSISDKTTVNRTSWTFNWTAPAAGAGPLSLYWGVVDGDCVMDSLGDDVKIGRASLAEATARAPSRRRYALALLVLVPLFALMWLKRREVV